MPNQRRACGLSTLANKSFNLPCLWGFVAADTQAGMPTCAARLRCSTRFKPFIFKPFIVVAADTQAGMPTCAARLRCSTRFKPFIFKPFMFVGGSLLLLTLRPACSTNGAPAVQHTSLNLYLFFSVVPIARHCLIPIVHATGCTCVARLWLSIVCSCLGFGVLACRWLALKTCLRACVVVVGACSCARREGGLTRGCCCSR